jgi:hypothetical protein
MAVAEQAPGAVVDLAPNPPLDRSGPPEDPSDERPALLELARRLGLSRFERDVLLLAVAPELDPELGDLCGPAQGDVRRNYPTFALALRTFGDPVWEALAPDRPLRRFHLVTLGGGGVVSAPLRPDERVVNYVKGLDHLDERLRSLLLPLGTGDGRVSPSPSQLETVEAVGRRARSQGSGSLVTNLVGADSASKRLLAQQAAGDLGLYLLRMPLANLPAPGPDLDVLVRLWERESLLSPVALYLDASDDVGDTRPEAVATTDRLLARASGLIFVDSREVWPRLGQSAVVVDVPSPTTAEQRTAWVEALGPGSEDAAARLAAQFDLDLLSIDDLAQADPGDGTIDARSRRIWQGALASTRPRLDLLAERVVPKATAEDLVLPADVSQQIARITTQVRLRSTVYTDWGLADRQSRGLGISALFAGESGTGKTLAAEVIAGELDLNLYRIDLSAVVSKYIGETEKNLRRLFDAAERGGTILFFDEADALFGKRSEVKDSHDRYANIEINYLLQRMEAYTGLAILATNMKGSLDPAFTRRLRFMVDFPFPGPQERERIWRRAFVARVRADRLDFARLARLTLTGGSIHNVAVNATFEAAATPEGTLTMAAVLRAARLEYLKLGLPLNDADFRADEPEGLRPATTATTAVPANGGAGVERWS